MRQFLFLLAVLMLLSSGGCAGDDDMAATLLMRGTHEIGRLPGDVYILGGAVTAPADADVRGSVYLLDGSLALDGQIEGDLLLFGGEVNLGPSAMVTGDLRLAGGEVESSPGAMIGGALLEGGAALPLDELTPERSAAESALRWIMAAVPLALAGYLLARRTPRAPATVAEAALRHPVVSVSVGALSALVLPALLVAMVFTLVLIPLALLLVGLLALVVGYGVIAVGWAAGEPLRRRTALSAPVATAVGTLLVMGLLFVIGQVPVVGGWLNLAATILLLGAVFLTRFGTRPFVPAPLEAAREW
jgi:cytoskeletal protein CcmA (bactofilin family)